MYIDDGPMQICTLHVVSVALIILDFVYLKIAKVQAVY